MFINNQDMRNLLTAMRNGTSPSSYTLNAIEWRLERSEEKEREALEEKKRQIATLRDRIYEVLSDGRSYTPTDIQFVIYNRYGCAYSLPKITFHVAHMTFGLTGEDAERWKGVEHDINANCGRGNRGKSYFHIVK